MGCRFFLYRDSGLYVCDPPSSITIIIFVGTLQASAPLWSKDYDSADCAQERTLPLHNRGDYEQLFHANMV